MQSILKEVESVKSFAKTRDGLPGGVNDLVLQGMVTSIIKQVNAVRSFGAQEAAWLSLALKDSPYGEAGTKQIASAIDAAISKTTSIATPGADEPKQFFKKWWTACTATDWDCFRSNQPWSAKMTCLIARANSIGCTHPDEQCVKWMLAMLLCVCYPELPTAKERFAKFQELKQCAITERQPFIHEHLVTFPTSVNDLPSHMWQHAYASESPINVELIGINLVANRIPLRKNSRLLQEPASADQAAKAVVDRSKAHIPIGEGPQASPSNAGHVPSASQAAMTFTDPEEIALHAKFQADLWKLRAVKQGVLGTSAEPNPASPDKLTLNHGPLGTIVLAKDGESTVQAESDVANSDNHVDHDVDHDVDPYAKAAIVALKERNKKKKAEAAQKKKRDAAEKKAEAAKKKEAEAAQAAEKQAHAKKKLPDTNKKADAKKKPDTGPKGQGNMPDTNKKPAMPADTKDGSNPAPVPFLTGIIYTQQKKHKFRGLRVKGDSYTEASSTWGSKRTKPEAWKFVIDAITKHAKKNSWQAWLYEIASHVFEEDGTDLLVCNVITASELWSAV